MMNAQKIAIRNAVNSVSLLVEITRADAAERWAAFLSACERAGITSDAAVVQWLREAREGGAPVASLNPKPLLEAAQAYLPS
jgi:hypothetical protein